MHLMTKQKQLHSVDSGKQVHPIAVLGCFALNCMFDLTDFLSPAESASINCQLPRFPDHLQHCLITGPVRCGKTSILLHYAYKLASKGKRVLFICQKAKIEQVPPLLPAGVEGNDGAFSNVHMRYLSTAADLQKIAACLHLLDELPEAIIIDDLSSFIDARGPEHGGGDKRQKDAELVRTLAFLHEATAYASKKLAAAPSVSGDPKCSCKLVVTDPVTDGPQNLQLMQRWLPLHLMIRGSGPDFTLSVVPQVLKANNLPVTSAAQLCYHLAPYSAITLVDVKPPVVEVDTATTVMSQICPTKSLIKGAGQPFQIWAFGAREIEVWLGAESPVPLFYIDC
ncbi:hypothetical protein COCOBI_01-6330 [Coccomyxa sp. Obi]|nr:hypothetical protein COCOBI_01-6330 [Coccomyxa sp. Obi]